jgi:CheY-like chemotaxis protein
MLNLVVNAFDAMDRSERPRKLLLQTRRVDQEVVLGVTDSGTGIDPDKLSSIFDPFVTTKATGLGMGLSLSRSIAIGHNGRLWAENNETGGATFQLALPVESSLGAVPARHVDATSQAETASGPEELTVLVVDDKESFRRAVCSILEDLPELKLLAEAADGAEAIQKASELKPQLVLLDVGLPSVNGVEAAARIRGVAPNAKIVFLTQYDSPDFVRAALKTGALGYVLKVDAASELLSASRAVLRGNVYLSAGLQR